jgi:hypothetical protein
MCAEQVRAHGRAKRLRIRADALGCAAAKLFFAGMWTGWTGLRAWRRRCMWAFIWELLAI